MNNYHYIVASLPEISPGLISGEKNADEIIEEIKEHCSSRDLALIGFLEKSRMEENLNAGFYREATDHRNRFIKDWFAFDLNVRNAKVRYLNNALGRDKALDIIVLDEDGDNEEFEEASKLAAILSGSDILARERGIDDLYWNKIDELTVFDCFDIEFILGFIAKLRIVDRWLKLDEQTGREMFRTLVDQVRGTFKGVEYDNK